MSECTTTPGLHNDGCECDTRITCPGCGTSLKRTTSGKYRKHGSGGCDFSQTVITEEEECNETNSTAGSQAASSVPSPLGGATETAPPATGMTPSDPPTPEPEDDASTASATPALPGVTEYATVLDVMSTAQLAAYRATVNAKLTPFSQPAPLDDEPEAQPTLFSQPAGRLSEEPAEPMSDLGRELTARLKEMFYAYDNRRSSDNRSAQATMGPSEMGTPCDRRLALSLMRMPPINPGGDGWAAFVGTCIHEGLAQMFMWADAGTGRFAVEQRLEFPSAVVPKGTADLIDRTLFMLDDHKCQGRWSRNKLKTVGASPLYRIQAHVYAHGARLRGEKIEHVAIISWPRDEATLDDLYVWTEPYNPAIAKRAFERVERIAVEVEAKQVELAATYPEPSNPDAPLQIKARVSADFDVADDCRFCPFYLPNSRDITTGCNGRK